MTLRRGIGGTSSSTPKRAADRHLGEHDRRAVFRRLHQHVSLRRAVFLSEQAVHSGTTIFCAAPLHFYETNLRPDRLGLVLRHF